MEITDPKFQHQIIIEQSRSRALESLRTGQVLQARVLTPTHEQRVTLRISGSDLQARTRISLEPGTQLLLKVLRPADPLQLQLIRTPPGNNPVADAMRVALPREMPVTELLSRLASAIDGKSPASPSGPAPAAAQGYRTAVAPAALPGPEAGAKPPPPVGPAANQLLPSLFQGPDGARLLEAVERVLGYRLDTAEALTPKRLRTALLASGLFLETTLAAGEKPASDLKANLLQLLFRLRLQMDGNRSSEAPVSGSIPGKSSHQGPVNSLQGMFLELFSRTEGSLARVLLNQLSSLPPGDSTAQQWHFDLPLANGGDLDAFRIRIAREGVQDSQGARPPSWSVSLNFNMEPIGPVTANLTLQGKEISSFFTAERPESARSIRDALPVLNQAFLRAGLSVGRMLAAEGFTDAKPRPPYPLLDEKA